MALYLRQTNGGPEVPEAMKDKGFRSYVDMANFADEINLPDGKYYCRNTSGTNLWTTIREITRKGGSFHVEGRGNI